MQFLKKKVEEGKKQRSKETKKQEEQDRSFY